MTRRPVSALSAAAETAQRWRNKARSPQQFKLPLANTTPLTDDYLDGILDALTWACGEENAILEHARAGGGGEQV